MQNSKLRLKTKSWNIKDQKYMKLALELAKKGLGKTSPNPVVGAVIVKDGKIISQGYHKQAGLAHAEIEALRSVAGRRGNGSARSVKKYRRRTTVCSPTVKGATMYVTLEPCCCYGRTPPCTEAIIKAGIKRVVVAMKDPNPKINGKGFQQLRKAGIKVEAGLMKKEAAELNAPFIFYIKNKRPYVVLKVAITLDGKIAPQRRRARSRRRNGSSPTGTERWITCPESRQWVQQLRSQVQAILVGVNTVLADDPRLTVRYQRRSSVRRTNGCAPSVGRQPLRIILDPQAKTPVEARALKQQGITIIVTNQQDIAKKQKKYQGRAWVLPCPCKQGKINLQYLLKQLGKLKVGTLLVEGGAEVFTSFIDQGLVNKYYFFIAPKVFRPQGLSFYQSKQVDKFLSFKFISCKQVGSDVLIEAES